IIALILIAAISALVANQAPAQKRRSRAPTGTVGQTEAWRRRPPQPDQLKPFELPATRETLLKNGLRLVMAEDHRMPLVTARLSLTVGSADDPEGSAGLAEAIAHLVTEGAGRRDSEELAREVERLGARLSAAAADDYSSIGFASIAENAERMIELLADVVLRPTFADEEVALFKENRIQELKVQRQEPAFVVSEQFNRLVYGSHPYAVSAPTPETVAAMTRSQIASYYRSRYTPSGSVIVIVGDFDSKKIEDRVKSAFGEWPKASAARTESVSMPEPAPRRIYLVDRPGSEQADFRIGGLAISRSHPDYFALLVANAILGDGASSRLFLNIRERKGYAYEVNSQVNAPRQRGTFFGESQTRTEVTSAAIKEMLAEFQRMRRERVTARDLENAKSYLTGLFSLILSTQGGLVSQMAETRLLGLGPDYLSSYRARISAVTAEQVQRVAQKYIQPDRAVIVVVGDAAKLKKALQTIGPVEVIDTEGKGAARS
ncbi:MAG TPA: pitrilysin family protein, partial [Blastocatellia bacterium]|nr:pitrilysin family protein [Blastocatellia bacterium]